VLDVVFIVLVIAVFAVMAVVVRGVERLVGQVSSSERTGSFGGEQHTVQPGATSGDGFGGLPASADAVGASVPADGRVVR
jgi:hypothetical protein